MIILSLVVIIILATFVITKLPQFGSNPKGERMEKMLKSPNYRNGEFQNINDTKMMVGERDGFLTVLKKMFSNSGNTVPSSKINTVKTDLKSIDQKEDVLIWFGHSSYFMQIDGKTFLVDPVFSSHASPFNFMIKSFDGTDIYNPDDIPAIDYLIISHDHYDHLDYKTIKAVEPKIGKVVTGLGVGETLSRWGYNGDKILEGDWWDEFNLDDNFSIRLTPTRHFSGRTFKRNQTLWSSFVLQAPNKKIYLGGDSGYDTHFRDIGDKYGPFDLAILENGQYNKAWAHIHMMPEETIQAGVDLKTKIILPVHWAKFKLAYNEWTDGIERASVSSAEKNISLMTPMIGEKVSLDGSFVSKKWWLDIK